MTHGPNVNRLIVERMSYLAVPKNGGLADVVRLFTEEGRLAAVCKQATADIEHALAVAKTARPNPYGDDDEAIAAEILRRIQERKDARNGPRDHKPDDAP